MGPDPRDGDWAGPLEIRRLFPEANGTLVFDTTFDPAIWTTEGPKGNVELRGTVLTALEGIHPSTQIQLVDAATVTGLFWEAVHE